MDSVSRSNSPEGCTLPSADPASKIKLTISSEKITSLIAESNATIARVREAMQASAAASSGDLASHHITATTSPVVTTTPNREQLNALSRYNEQIRGLLEKEHDLKQRCSEQSGLIISKAKEEVHQLEKRAQATPERALIAGLPSVLKKAPRPEELKKTKDLIHNKAISKLLATSLEYKEASLAIQQFFYGKLLKKRTIHNNPSPGSTKGTELLGDKTEVSDLLTKTLELKQRALTYAKESLDQPTKEGLEFVTQVICAADALASIALAKGAESTVEKASSSLEKMLASFDAIARNDLPQGNKFSSHKLIQELHKRCQQDYAALQFVGVDSDLTAGNVAREKVEVLLRKAHSLREDAAKRNSQIPYASEEDKISLKAGAATLERLAALLENMALAYDQISDVCFTELRAIPFLKKNLQQTCTALLDNPEISAGENPFQDPSITIRQNLLSLLKKSDLSVPTSTKAFELRALLEFGEDMDQHAITGSCGKMMVTSLPSSFSSDSNRQPYIQGIHLIRLAIFRDFGGHSLQRFDREFDTNIKAQTPLTVGALKRFFALEQAAYNSKSSYFVSEHHSIEELLAIEETAPDAAKIIKADGFDPLSFNPFLVTSTVDKALLPEEKSTEEGIKVIRVSLKNFLETEAFLEPVQIKTILQNFDTTFNEGDPDKQLTVGAFNRFLTEELKRVTAGLSLLEWLSASPQRPGINSLLWRIVTAGSSSILMSNPQIPAMVKFVILAIQLAVGDYTTFWRTPQSSTTQR